MPAQKLNAQRALVAEDRRRMVAALMLRKRMSQTQIHAALGKNPDTRNPETGKPWSIQTISTDFRVIKEHWREETRQEFGEYVASINAELEEVIIEAWRDKDIKSVIDALKAKMDLLGIKGQRSTTAPAELDAIAKALADVSDD